MYIFLCWCFRPNLGRLAGQNGLRDAVGSKEVVGTRAVVPSHIRLVSKSLTTFTLIVDLKVKPFVSSHIRLVSKLLSYTFPLNVSLINAVKTFASSNIRFVLTFWTFFPLNVTHTYYHIRFYVKNKLKTKKHIQCFSRVSRRDRSHLLCVLECDRNPERHHQDWWWDAHHGRVSWNNKLLL
jgi:hypothetical protein